MDREYKRMRTRFKKQLEKWNQKELNHAKRVAQGSQESCDYMTLERAHELLRADARKRIR